MIVETIIAAVFASALGSIGNDRGPNWLVIMWPLSIILWLAAIGQMVAGAIQWIF